MEFGIKKPIEELNEFNKRVLLLVSIRHSHYTISDSYTKEWRIGCLDSINSNGKNFKIDGDNGRIQVSSTSYFMELPPTN